jgi:hypothetical protein
VNGAVRHPYVHGPVVTEQNLDNIPNVARRHLPTPGLTYRYSGRDFRLTDLAGVVAKGVVA